MKYLVECNNFNRLSRLTAPERDLDLLTKTGVKDDVQVKGNVTSTANSNEDDVFNKFSSFAFWRQPLPCVDVGDLAAILASARGRLTSDAGEVDADDDAAADFDEFNYWRVPITEPDLSDLLRCLHQL